MFPRRGDAFCTSRRCELRYLAAWAERVITRRQIDVSVDGVGVRHPRLQQLSSCLVPGPRQYPRVGEVDLKTGHVLDALDQHGGHIGLRQALSVRNNKCQHLRGALAGPVVGIRRSTGPLSPPHCFVVKILVIGVWTRGAEWSAKAKIRPSHPPAASPVSGLLDSFLTPGPGGGGGESHSLPQLSRLISLPHLIQGPAMTSETPYPHTSVVYLPHNTN
nr:unnamed protein product [Spirometra erinaceieuropaei]